MRAILISIKPKWVAKILNGEKGIEIRKTMPKCELPIDVYIYCTKDKKYTNLINRGGFLTGMVVAKFTLNKVEEIEVGTKENIEQKDYSTFYSSIDEMKLFKASCLDAYEILKYAGYCDDFFRAYKYKVYAWHISNLVIFDKPKELGEFKVKKTYICKNCPPKYQYGVCLKDCTETLSLTKAPQSWQFIESEQ